MTYDQKGWIFTAIVIAVSLPAFLHDSLPLEGKGDRLQGSATTTHAVIGEGTGSGTGLPLRPPGASFTVSGPAVVLGCPERDTQPRRRLRQSRKQKGQTGQ